MKRKHKRLTFVFLGGVILAIAASLMLFAFKDNIVFFFSPTEIIQKSQSNEISSNQRLRIGGLVEKGSVNKGTINRFKVTDLKTSINVEFKGILPDLFREGQGIVAEGKYNNKIFIANEVLAILARLAAGIAGKAVASDTLSNKKQDSFEVFHGKF